MTVGQWKWKYTGQGLHDNKSAVIANDEGLIVGHFGGISLRMWFRDRFTIAYQGTDLMVHKNYRGPLNKRGLYFEIGRFFYENLPSFVYGFINPDHFRLGKLLGFFEDAIVVNDHRIDTLRISCRHIPLRGWNGITAKSILYGTRYTRVSDGV